MLVANELIGSEDDVARWCPSPWTRLALGLDVRAVSVSSFGQTLADDANVLENLKVRQLKIQLRRANTLVRILCWLILAGLALQSLSCSTSRTTQNPSVGHTWV